MLLLMDGVFFFFLSGNEIDASSIWAVPLPFFRCDFDGMKRPDLPPDSPSATWKRVRMDMGVLHGSWLLSVSPARWHGTPREAQTCRSPAIFRVFFYSGVRARNIRSDPGRERAEASQSPCDLPCPLPLSAASEKEARFHVESIVCVCCTKREKRKTKKQLQAQRSIPPVRPLLRTEGSSRHGDC